MAFDEICSNQDSLIKDLKDRINLYAPASIIITPKRINDFVRQAISSSDLANNIDPENIFSLYFPGNGWQNKYISGLKSALYSLIRKKIIPWSN